MPDQPEYLKAEDVAELLQVSRPHVMHLMRTAGLPGIKLGRLYRFERAAVLAWLAKQQSAA